MLLAAVRSACPSQGYHALGTGQQVLKDWVFTTIAVNEGWAADHRAAIVAILRALREAVQFGATHKAEAIATLISYTHTTPEIAAKTYELDFNQWKAFRADLGVTPEQLATIADIRSNSASSRRRRRSPTCTTGRMPPRLGRLVRRRLGPSMRRRSSPQSSRDDL